MSISREERDVMRSLAERIEEASSHNQHKEKRELWTRLNDLKKVKPLIWINEIPWHEMDVQDKLKIRTTHPFLQEIEKSMRQTLYQWEYMPGDMIVEGTLYSPETIQWIFQSDSTGDRVEEDTLYSSLAIHKKSFGIGEDTAIVKTDERSTIVSRHFQPQIDCEEDIKKIQIPIIVHQEEKSQEHFHLLDQCVGDIISVQRRGLPGLWFAPWDELIRWWGVDKALMDMILRPELVHMAMERLMEAYLSLLDQLEEKSLLARNDSNVRIGSGGYGYTEELPPSGFDPNTICTKDLWGSAAAQIFSEVSPVMHEEFALNYELRWLKRFGLTYYGCCDPLHRKMDILKKIPNLRKISMSTWVALEEAVEAVGTEYVFSYKPNPAIFAQEKWNPKKARKELRDVLEKTKGCIVELIMKDISTVRYEPHRLWEWAEIAREETEYYA